MGPLGWQELLFILVMSGGLLLIFVIPLLKILSKAGLSPALVVLALIPLIGLPLLLFLIAFTDWPTLRTGPPGPHSSPGTSI